MINSADDPRSQASQMAVIKLLSTPPEPIMEMIERLEIPWKKIQDKEGNDRLVILWSDLREGEKRNQAQGPFIRKVLEQLQADVKEEG